MKVDALTTLDPGAILIEGAGVGTVVADEPNPSKCVCQATPPAIATTPIPTIPAKTVRRETTRLLSVTGSRTGEGSEVTGAPVEDPMTGVTGAETAETECPLIGVMRA